MDFKGIKYLIVGAGFSGAVIANKIATDLHERVLVIDKRSHAGGNSYSEVDPVTGIDCHMYGSHIFHTSDLIVWKFINQFCSFNHYRHRVLTMYQGQVYSMPVNLGTLNQFFKKTFSPSEARTFIQNEIDGAKVANPCNLEEKAISLIGKSLYDAFIKNYTIKQWGTNPIELPEEIITRIPVRYSYKTDYFDDPYQGVPVGGYADVFVKMLDHPNIDTQLGVDFFAIRHLIPRDCCLVYTGPIDQFFDYKFGFLGWRGLRFEKEVHATNDYQGTTVMNFADIEIPFTRVHEFRHYHDERTYSGDSSVIFKEYPVDCNRHNDPCYPINTRKDRKLLAQYQTEASGIPNTFFCGRLGNYKYLDMDQAIARALDLYENGIKARLTHNG